MDKQVHSKKCKIDEDTLDKLIGFSSDVIIHRLGEPISKSSEEWIYYLDKKSFLGIFKTKIYLFFHKGILREYYIGA